MNGPDVSRQGVQRDLLPIVEGSTVNTKYGMVKTDHILFIASGAFHTAKPSDLIPEFQGRFPIRVELSSLTKADFVRILTEPKNALIKQYEALLETERRPSEVRRRRGPGNRASSPPTSTSARKTSARAACTRFSSVCSMRSPLRRPKCMAKKSTIDAEYVRERLAPILNNEDLSRYIL